MTANEGIVIESDREHYAFQAPFALLPDLASSAITDSLIDERYFPILPLSLGLTVGAVSYTHLTGLCSPARRTR